MAAPFYIPSAAEADRELIKRRGLHEFVKRAWSQVEPAAFNDNWHIGAICEHLEACQRNEINRLIVNVPPGSGKSLITAVFFPVWAWTREEDPDKHLPGPATRFHYLSYDQKLSLRDAIRARDLVGSSWFQARWPVNNPFKNTRSAAYYKNSEGGMRITVTLGGGSTGHHAHIQCVDDPIKPKDTQGNADKTRTILRKVEDLWSGTLATRIADPEYFVRIIIMQRLHDADLCGSELSHGGYTHLMIPLRYEAKRAYSTGIGKTYPKDPRIEDGQLMWPTRTNEERAAQLEKELGPFASAQLQQDPVPTSGGIFQREWFKQFWATPEYLDKLPGTVPLPRIEEMITLFSWDMTFKKTDGSDYVAGGAWGRKGANIFLIDQSHARRSYVETKEEVIRFSKRYPKIIRKLVEEAANGHAVIDDLKHDVPGLEGVPPDGGKEARAYASTPLWKAGNVYLPHPDMPGYGWVRGYIEEHCRFPKAPHDDQVDQTSQALNYLHTNVPLIWQAMGTLKGRSMI